MAVGTVTAQEHHGGDHGVCLCVDMCTYIQYNACITYGAVKLVLVLIRTTLRNWLNL